METKKKDDETKAYPPLTDPEFRKGGLSPMTFEERRKWEVMFTRLHEPHEELVVKSGLPEGGNPGDFLKTDGRGGYYWEGAQAEEDSPVESNPSGGAITEYPSDAMVLYLPSIHKFNPYYENGVYGDMEESKYHAGTGGNGTTYWWYRAFCKFNLCPLWGRILTTCELQWLLASTAFKGSGGNAQLSMVLHGLADYGTPDKTDWSATTLTDYGVVNVYDDEDGTVYSKDVMAWIQSLIDARAYYAAFRFQGYAVTPPTLVVNGGFDSSTTGWTDDNGPIASIAGGQDGNCLRITYNTGAYQRAYQDIALVAGETYTFSAYVKSGTSGNEAYKLEIKRVSDGGDAHSVTGNTTASWVQKTITAFEAASTEDYRFSLIKDTATAGTMLFDTAAATQDTWTAGDEPADPNNANNYRLSEVLLYCEF